MGLRPGALIAITAVTLTVLYGQTRIMFAMSRNGLVPKWVGTLSKRQTPARITLFFGILTAILAAFVPLSRRTHSVRQRGEKPRIDDPEAGAAV